LVICFLRLVLANDARAAEANSARADTRSAVAVSGPVYVIPIREEIAPPLTYLVRRGVKQAMEAGASAIILDMDTNGGRLDVTEDILQILSNFKGRTITYVNTKAFSAGAFIAVGTEKIYMAPQSVIGAAAPILMGPGGGVQEMPETVRAKMTSGVKALVRTRAEKNGHNPDVIEAMIDPNKELVIDGATINPKGQILTLTSKQAGEKHGPDHRPLLSAGTAENIPAVLAATGFSAAKVVRVEPSGAEKLGFWLNKISPVLLIIGIIGIWIEIKTPGFGLPGTAGIIAFALYFLGGLIAGLTGLEWIVVFILGLGLVIVELFVIPGTLIVGLAGGAMILAGLAMAMVDRYPGMGAFPDISQIQTPLLNVLVSFSVALLLILVLGRFVLRAPLFARMTSSLGSGIASVAVQEQKLQTLLGSEGVAVSPLRPGGKVQLGEQVLDALSQSEFIAKGSRIRVVGKTGTEVVVEPA
jgi:membrane-bound serine protease (ClpP class)